MGQSYAGHYLPYYT